MKQTQLILSASIAAALAATSALAQPSAGGNPALAGVNTAEPARVTQAVDTRVVATVQGSHLQFVEKTQPIGELADSTPMSHLQLVLRRSAARQAALDSLIADQHNPKSSRFNQWLTPEEFGDNFGVADQDIAATKAWLVSQGFKVNGVYPNKMQIDFSGTAGLVRKAFNTQENRYKFKDGSVHVANASDATVPVALREVVVGVTSLNDLHPKAMHLPVQVAQLDKATQKFKVQHSPMVNAIAASHPDAVNFVGGTRGLVPYDLNKIYAVDQLHAKGITGKGITIAVVEDGSMVPGDWTNFVAQFDLGSYGGTFAQIQPQAKGFLNCIDPTINAPGEDDIETLLDAEWSTAMAPGANVEVASCDDENGSNFFQGVFTAATNLINGTQRPNVISASYGYGEDFTDTPSKTAIDLMWAQADAEGISVFVSSGDSGSNPSFNGSIINGVGNSTNSFGTSPNVTVVGGLDTADVLAGTTSKYFSPSYNSAYGSALSYVPEIPWNQSCGNPLAARAAGFVSALQFCKEYLVFDPFGLYATSESGSGGPSSVDAKPAWQRQIYNAQPDQSRDVPDVSLFAGSYGNYTAVILCAAAYPCVPGFDAPTILEGGTSLSSPMFAGIQALVDQGLAAQGAKPYQGNAAPTLYALAALEYGGANKPLLPSLTACSSNNGTTGTAGCVFHNVTTGGNSTQCIMGAFDTTATTDCYYYGNIANFEEGAGPVQIGLTSTSSTQYTSTTASFSSRLGWSFAAGLGSVNATNLLSAWEKFDNLP